MTSHFKITQPLLQHIRADLRRPHPIAYERVGFLTCRFGITTDNALLILGHTFHPVLEDDYLDEPGFGALVSGNAFRLALQIALVKSVGLFHVHLHDHPGRPRPSVIDIKESSNFVPDFFHVRPRLPHGTIILSADSVSGRVWLSSDTEPTEIDRISVVGYPMLCTRLRA